MFSTDEIPITVDTLQAMVNAMPSPLFLINREHGLVMANDAYCEMVGCTRGNVVKSADIPVPEKRRAEFSRGNAEVFTTGQPHESEELVTIASGEVRVILIRRSLIHLMTTQGKEPFILASITDVTRFREAEARAQNLADHDPLTGLANRNKLAVSLADIAHSKTASDKKAALLMIDLDGFKTINDQHGHLAGDRALLVVSKRLAAKIRSGDIVARLGGDEFCVVQSTGEQPSSAFALAERIVSSLAQPFSIGTHQAVIGASIGIAIFPEDGETPEALMHSADRALYKVKRSGRSGYLRYGANWGRTIFGR